MQSTAEIHSEAIAILYINDMEAADQCQFILYADDSALLVSGKKIEEHAAWQRPLFSEWMVGR